jgi:hypothetical protein
MAKSRSHLRYLVPLLVIVSWVALHTKIVIMTFVGMQLRVQVMYVYIG